MSTRHVGDRALPFLEQELSPAEHDSIREHLEHCVDCRAEVDAIRSAVAAWRGHQAQGSMPHFVEREVIRALQAQRNNRKRKWILAAAAAGIATLSSAGGFKLGTEYSSRIAPAVTTTRSTSSQAAADTTLPAFLLLLEERQWPPRTPLARTGYSAWTRSLVSAQRFDGARKLTEEPGVRLLENGLTALPEASERPPNISGWYIVRAADYDAAIRLARLGPHLRYGSILVRQLE